MLLRSSIHILDSRTSERYTWSGADVNQTKTVTTHIVINLIKTRFASNTTIWLSLWAHQKHAPTQLVDIRCGINYWGCRNGQKYHTSTKKRPLFSLNASPPRSWSLMKGFSNRWSSCFGSSPKATVQQEPARKHLQKEEGEGRRCQEKDANIYWNDVPSSCTADYDLHESRKCRPISR